MQAGLAYGALPGGVIRSPPSTDEKKLIELLTRAPDARLVTLLKCIQSWQFEGQADIYNWVPVLDKLQTLLRTAIAQCPRLIVVPARMSATTAAAENAIATTAISKEKSEPSGCTDDLEQEMTEQVYQVLRFTAILLENASNKHMYTSIETVVNFLGARNDRIVFEATHVLAMMTLPPHAHRHATDPSPFMDTNASRNSVMRRRLLTVAKGQGAANSSMDLVDYLRSNTTSEEFTFQFYGEESSSHELNAQVVTIRIPPFQACDDDERTDALGAPAACAAANTCEVLIQQYHVPAKYHFSFFTKIRECYAARSKRSKEAIVVERMYALVALFYAFGESWDITNYIEQSPELTRGIVELIRVEIYDTIPVQVRVGALQVLTALVHDRIGRGGGIGVLGRQSNVLSILGVTKGTPHGVFPSLVRFCMAELGNVSLKVTGKSDGSPSERRPDAESSATALAPEPDNDMDMSLAVAFVQATTDLLSAEEADIVSKTAFRDIDTSSQDAKLYWAEAVLSLLTAVVAIQSGAAVLTENGVIPALLHVITTPAVSSYHLTLITQCVQALETTVNSHASAAALYRDLNGVGILIDRLMVECSSISTVPSPGVSTPSLSETTVVFLVALLIALSTSFHSQGVMTAGATSRVIREGSVLSKVLTKILGHIEVFGPVLFSQAAVVVSDVINNDPSSVNHVHSSGIADVLLNTLTRWDVSELYPSNLILPPCSQLAIAIPSVLNALSLTTSHAEKVAKYDPLLYLLDMFASPQHTEDETTNCFQGDVPSIVGTGIFELVRHVPSFQNAAILACVKALKKITRFGEEILMKRSSISENGILLRMASHLADLLEPVLSKSEHAAFFADHGGVQLLLKLYHLILPTGASFISSNLGGGRGHTSNISTSHHAAAQSITLVLRSFASQQPTSMLTAIIQEVNMQLDSLKSARTAIGLSWPFSESEEGAEGILCALPDIELSVPFGEKSTNEIVEENSRNDQKIESVGVYLRVLATIEWQCTLLIWTIQVVQSHLQCRRWFTEFSSKPTQQILSRLFSVDRSCQFERAKLASLHQMPVDVKKDKDETSTTSRSRAADKKTVTSVWKVGSLLLLRFTMVMRNLLSAYGKAFLSAPLRRGDESGALLAPHARALAKTVASILHLHLRYVLSKNRANEIDEFTRQYYLTFLLETFVCCVIGNKKNHANTLVLVELMKPTERSISSALPPPIVKTEQMLHQDESMDQEISTTVQVSSTDQDIPDTQISSILNIIGEFFTICLRADKNDEGLVMPSKMDMSSFRVAARALRKLSDLSNISKSPLTSGLIVNEESSLPSIELEARFDPRKLTVQLHCMCTRTLLTIWNHHNFTNLPVEGCISEMLPVAVTLLRNRLDQDDTNVESASTRGIESEFEFGRRQGFGFGRESTDGGDIDSLSLRSALFGGSSSHLSGRANPRDFAVDPRVVESLTAMGFTSSRVEHAIRRIQVNDVELAMEWILSHPEEENDEEEMEEDTNVSGEVPMEDATTDSEAKTQEKELFELYNKLRDTYEQVCFSILQTQSTYFVPISANEEHKRTSGELYRGQHFVMTIAEYLCFLCRQSDSERRLVISRLAGAILEWFEPDVDRNHRCMAMLAMLSHVLALVLRLDVGSRAVLQEESPLCVQKLLDFVSNISRDSQLQIIVAPVLLAVGALVGDKTTSDAVKPDQVVNAADSNQLVMRKELEFQERLMDTCMLFLKIIAAPSTGVFRNQLNSNIAHAIWQLLARLTLNYEFASSFFTRGGIDDILTISDENIFPGYCELTCTLLLQVMESPEVLQQMMEENILQAMSKLSTRYGSPSQMRFTPRALLMEVAPIAARNEVLFLKALQNTISMKKSDSGRVYVVPKKSHPEVSSTVQITSDPTELSRQLSNEAKDKKPTNHHKIPKGHKHQAQMIIHKIIDKIQSLWEIEKTISKNDESNSQEANTNDDTQPVVCVGMYLRFLVHLVTFFPVCATVLAKAKYALPNGVARDNFIRTVLMEFLPSKDLCQFAALRKSLREGGLHGSNAGLVEGGLEISASEAVKFVDKRTRERVQNAHRLLVGIGSHSGEGSKCIIMELVRLLQEWPSGAVGQQNSLDSDETISDELALSKLHAWSGLIMSILWPKGSSKGFAWDKVVLGGGLKGKHSFVTLLAEALRKIDLAHPLAHATCSMLLRPLATLTRSFVTHRVRRLLKKRHSSSSENEALSLTSHSPEVASSAMLDHFSSNDQVNQDVMESSSEMTNRSEDTINRAPSVPQVGDDIGDITMQSPQIIEDDHVMLDDDGGERSDDDDASERSSVSVRSTDDGDDDEDDEEDGEDDEDEDEEEDDEDDEDDDDEDEDDEDERMNLRILRRRDGNNANRRVSGNRLWGSLDAELSTLDALDEVDEDEFSYLNLLDDEASFADEQRRRIRRAARANGSLNGSGEDISSGRQSSTWNDERIVRSVMSASNLSSSGIDTQTDVIPFVSDDGDNDPEEQTGEPLPDTSRFPLGQRDSVAGTAMLLQFIEDLPGVEDEFLFDSLDSRGARGHRSRSDHHHNRGAASGLDMSASSITHPLLRSDNAAHAADNDGDQMPDRLGLPRHSSLLRELQELTEHVQNQMPFSFGGSRARLGLGGIAREPLHRGGGGRARPPSRSNRLSAVSNLLSEFSLDIPASSQMRLHDSRIDSQFRHYGLGASQVFGGHRASRGDTGDGNSISVWGPPGASREVNIRSMVSRLEQRIGEVCTEVSNDEQASSPPRNDENLHGNELAIEEQEQSDHNDDAESATEAESMIMDEVTGPICSNATEDTNTVDNVLDASRSDSASPADDQIESSEVASDTASVLALASTFGESSLQSPGDTDNDHNTSDAVAPAPSQGFDTEVHETENASTAQDESGTLPPPAPVIASSGSSEMLNFTLDLSSIQASSSSAGSVSDFGSTAPDRLINSLESHEETKSETEVEGSRSLNEAAITETTNGFVCPEGIDPEVFDSLPPDMQAEIIAQSAPVNSPSSAAGSVAATVGSESFSQMDLDMANSSFDRETLEALPADIRAEVLANERREREAVAAAAAEPAADISRAQEMDNASFVASLAPELREEILVTCDDAFLQTLPSLVRAEAMVLRERVAFRSTYREPDHDRSRARGAEGETGDLFRRPTLRRMLTSQGDDGLGGSRRSGRRSFYSDGTIRRSSRRDAGHDRSYTGKLRVDRDEEEDEHDRIFDDRCVKSLLRLLFMAQSVIYNRVFQRLLANISLYPLTRQSIRTNILRVISLPLDRPLMSNAPEDKDDNFPPLALYGCSGSENRVFRDKEKLTIPGDVVNRTLHVLVSLAKYNPRFTVELLQAHGMCRTESVDVSGVSKTPHRDESGVAVLIELLAHPVIYRNGSNLDTLLELIELVLAPLQRFSTRKEEETKEEEDNVDPSAAARDRGEWVTVPPLELDASRMNDLVRILGLDICTPQMQERTVAILRLLNRVAGASNRQLVMDALVRQASALASTCRYEPIDNTAQYESSAVLRSAQDELQLLRLLHTLSDVCAATSSFTECCRTIRLDPLWDALSASLEDARSNGGLEDLETTPTSASGMAIPAPPTPADDDSADGMVIEGKSAGASCAMAALLARFLPMVEAFFVVNARDAASMSLKMPDSLEREEAVVAALRLGGLDSTQPAASETGTEADGSKPPPSEGSSLVPLRRTLSRTLSEPSETMRLANFVAANRVLLNTLVREKPSLLETSLAALIKMPRCRAYLDFDNKRAYFQSAMKRLRQTALRSHGGGSSSVRIPVRRDHIFEDSYYALRMRSGAELRRKLHISFTGEEGIDAGGVTREWYMMLAREMFNPNYVLFTSAADSPTFQPNPLSYVNKDHLSYFEFVGKVLGKAVADGQLLDAHFTRSFYKHILQIPISYHDMEAIDPEYYRNLHAILDHPIADLGLDLTFSAENLNFGKVEIVDLIPNGRHIAVTDSNKLEYVQLVTHHRMATGIRQQIDAFLHGFHQLVPPEMIAIFNENELELLISGMPEIDIDDLKANTEYANFKPTDSVIRWFWNVLYTFTHEERALFLQFVTGTSKVPLEGFKALEGMRGTQKFNIHKAFGNPNALPSAHTCFNQLDLPDYESEEKLKQRLLLAIREGSEGFGFG